MCSRGDKARGLLDGRSFSTSGLGARSGDDRHFVEYDSTSSTKTESGGSGSAGNCSIRHPRPASVACRRHADPSDFDVD
ncbi:MAG: hypothetical protein Ct9H300mP12_09890 [Acidimicrobiales bacterium]|nr:MAG: hypothetical protein Ct9H300mP12_09890 [Acidimicrobiales bacterium]